MATSGKKKGGGYETKVRSFCAGLWGYGIIAHSELDICSGESLCGKESLRSEEPVCGQARQKSGEE
jgi:hypothetical protein